jgi:hypothetical protein
LATGRLVRLLHGQGRAARTVAFSQNGGLLAAAFGDGTVQVWDVRGGDLRTTLGCRQPAGALAFSPDGRSLATAEATSDQRGQAVRIWDLTTGTEVRALPPLPAAVHHLAFAPNGRTLAAAGSDGRTSVWGLADGRLRQVLQGHERAVRSVAYSPNGHTLATAGLDGVVRLWETETWTELAVLRLPGRAFTAVAFAPDGQALATADNPDEVRLAQAQRAEDDVEAEIPDPGTLRLWDPVTREVKAVLHGHSGNVWGLAFAADGRTLASVGGLDGQLGEVKQWDLAAEAEQVAVRAPRVLVDRVAFSPDGQSFATGTEAALEDP